MPRVPFEDLPESARLWVFGADRTLTSTEEATVISEVDRFLDGWRAHGAPLRAAREVRYGQFLFVAVDDEDVPPSGCSIDALVHALQDVERQYGLSLIDNGRVWYRSEDGVMATSRADFRRLAEAREVGPDTTVFDNTLTRVGQLRGSEWEGPAADRWHARAFFRGVSAG